MGWLEDWKSPEKKRLTLCLRWKESLDRMWRTTAGPKNQTPERSFSRAHRNVSYLSQVDQPAAVVHRRWCSAWGYCGDRRGLVLFLAQIYEGWVSADSAHRFPSLRACGPVGTGLPVLSQCSGKVVVFKRADGFYLHQLPRAEKRKYSGGGSQTSTGERMR